MSFIVKFLKFLCVDILFYTDQATSSGWPQTGLTNQRKIPNTVIVIGEQITIKALNFGPLISWYWYSAFPSLSSSHGLQQNGKFSNRPVNYGPYTSSNPVRESNHFPHDIGYTYENIHQQDPGGLSKNSYVPTPPSPPGNTRGHLGGE